MKCSATRTTSFTFLLIKKYCMILCNIYYSKRKIFGENALLLVQSHLISNSVLLLSINCVFNLMIS